MTPNSDIENIKKYIETTDKMIEEFLTANTTVAKKDFYFMVENQIGKEIETKNRMKLSDKNEKDFELYLLTVARGIVLKSLVEEVDKETEKK